MTPLTTSTITPSLPYSLTLYLIESAAEEESHFDHSVFLDAFRTANGNVEELSELQKATAYAFLADGAQTSTDPLIAGPSCPTPSQIPTSTFYPSPSLSSHGFSRSTFIDFFSSLAWKNLDASSLEPSMDTLELLGYLASRFDHPEGAEVKMERVAEGISWASEVLDEEERPDKQGRAFMLGSSLVAIAGEESWTHSVLPLLTPYVLGQFVKTSQLTPLPLPPHEVSAVFTGGESFVALFDSVILPLQNLSSEIERLHAKDIIDHSSLSSTSALDGIWTALDKAFFYTEICQKKVLENSRLEKSEKGFIDNTWTRAFLKNLLIQKVGLVGFEGVVWRNLCAGVSAGNLRGASEDRVLKRLGGLARDLDEVKHLTKTLQDIAPLVLACYRSIHRFGPPADFVDLLTKLPSEEVASIKALLIYASYYDSRAGVLVELIV